MFSIQNIMHLCVTLLVGLVLTLFAVLFHTSQPISLQPTSIENYKKNAWIANVSVIGDTRDNQHGANLTELENGVPLPLQTTATRDIVEKGKAR